MKKAPTDGSFTLFIKKYGVARYFGSNFILKQQPAYKSNSEDDADAIVYMDQSQVLYNSLGYLQFFHIRKTLKKFLDDATFFVFALIKRVTT